MHEGGFRLRLDEQGQVEVRDPRGVVLRPAPPPPDAGAVERANRAAGLRIDAGTNACGWEGRSAGLSDIVAYLDHHARAGAR